MLDAMSWGPDATFDLADAVATVRSFGSLTEDWDGSGGVPFDPRTVRHAETILTISAKWVSVPAVYPESNGTVMLDGVADDDQCRLFRIHSSRSPRPVPESGRCRGWPSRGLCPAGSGYAKLPGRNAVTLRRGCRRNRWERPPFRIGWSS